MNRVRDQLLAGAGFSLDKNGGIRRRNPFDLFEHRFQSRTIASDLLEFALIRRLIPTPESLDSSHRQPPRTRALYRAQFSRAPRTLSTRTPSSNSLPMNSTPPVLI